MEALILTIVNTHLLPASDQHGFRTGHSTTSALLQLTSYVATGFNQRKPPHRTVCVAVDLTAAFDTVDHNALFDQRQGYSTLAFRKARSCCCCLPTPMALASGGSPMFPLVKDCKINASRGNLSLAVKLH